MTTLLATDVSGGHAALDRTTMRAARLHRPGEAFQLDSVPTPRARPTDVVVEVKACGVIPNLLNVVRNISTVVHQPQLPAIYGLDAAGVIVEKGDQVHGFNVGDRVYVNPVRYCGSCKYCRSERTSGCPYATLNGYFGLGSQYQEMFADYPYGGYAEFMTAPQYSLVPLSEQVSFELAARWGYLGTGYAAARQAGVNMSTNVLVNGATGTLGLGTVLWALALGAPKILGVGRNLDLLKKLKAIDPDRIHIHQAGGDQSVADWARSLTDGDGADVVIDTLPTGTPAASFLAALDALGPCGVHVNVSGVVEPVPISVISLAGRTQKLIGSCWFTTAEANQMVDLATSGRVRLDVFEHHRFPLDDINGALDTLDNRNGGFSNYVICP